MNRAGLGLAVGAGYLLGRTKKLKLAVAVGTMVAGKKLNLSPKGIADLVSTQLQNNPQVKEIGDQLRTELRGAGKAASGAMVERQIDALADRLHGRTARVRDQVSGVASGVPGVGSDDSDDSRDSRDSEDSEGSEPDAEYEDERHEDEPHEDERSARGPGEEREERREPRRERAAKKAPPPPRKAASKAPAKKAAGRAPEKKAAAKRTQPAKKAVGKKTAAARSAARGAGPRQSKGGGER
ncbi:DNA primase [Streptomyces sp. AC627_RSS907]|uniref:DNA primase n=1 Tax=Streptomyces sp. AC627_RSS907 TaxID=2823684 RepID=UPI001C2493FE|nr:DNA primase [Streptomyces sp. AC627_RSS907]